MKTTIYKLGEEMGHDIQITAQTVCTYSESEYNGKKWPARCHIHILADVRLDVDLSQEDGQMDLIARALAVYDAMRTAYENYPDGEVEVSMRIVDHGCNL